MIPTMSRNSLIVQSMKNMSIKDGVNIWVISIKIQVHHVAVMYIKKKCVISGSNNGMFVI